MTQRARRGETGYHAGLSAEERVAQHYQQRGLSVACRRWRGGGGEIDLIVRDGEIVIFVEVKKSRDFARAAERLSARQMARIHASATEFLDGEPRGSLTPARFDVALVDGMGAMEIVENAFGHG
ncbi:YraN family protein [Cribrihabitans sp. XS_ASV171]